MYSIGEDLKRPAREEFSRPAKPTNAKSSGEGYKKNFRPVRFVAVRRRDDAFTKLSKEERDQLYSVLYVKRWDTSLLTVPIGKGKRGLQL